MGDCVGVALVYQVSKEELENMDEQGHEMIRYKYEVLTFFSLMQMIIPRKSKKHEQLSDILLYNTFTCHADNVHTLFCVSHC